MTFLIFIFGAIIGSFLNVIICRLETGEEMVKKRSHCPKCGQILAWYDLIPIVSFFILWGRCRACGEKISRQYPLVEAATGALFIITVFQFFSFSVFQFETWSLKLKTLISLCFMFYVISSMIVIFVYDLRHYIIPDIVLWPAIAATALYRIFEALEGGQFVFSPFVKGDEGGFIVPFLNGGFGGVYPYLLSAFAAAVFFIFLILITRGQGMGLGDAKLAILMGLLLGWPNILLALFLAFLLGAVVGIGLIAAGRKTMKSPVPFGPFLIIGTLLALFWGQAIIDWYRNLFFVLY